MPTKTCVIRVDGTRDDAATLRWVAARGRAPRPGASLVSSDGWRVWAECRACGDAYAFHPAPRSDHAALPAGPVELVTACSSCGEDVVVGRGRPWEGAGEPVAASPQPLETAEPHLLCCSP